jgi:peptide/nickel transport system ATP-binding protein
MLMASVPRLDKKWDEVEIKADVDLRAKNLATGGGCVYYGRCPWGDKDCTQGTPALIEMESDHYVACIRYAEGGSGGQAAPSGEAAASTTAG